MRRLAAVVLVVFAALDQAAQLMQRVYRGQRRRRPLWDGIGQAVGGVLMKRVPSWMGLQIKVGI